MHALKSAKCFTLKAHCRAKKFATLYAARAFSRTDFPRSRNSLSRFPAAVREQRRSMFGFSSPEECAVVFGGGFAYTRTKLKKTYERTRRNRQTFLPINYFRARNRYRSRKSFCGLQRADIFSAKGIWPSSRSIVYFRYSVYTSESQVSRLIFISLVKKYFVISRSLDFLQ